MSHHNFVFAYETSADHVFECVKCGLILGFNKPGVGLPTAELGGDVPKPPLDAETYVSECEVTDAA